jgi:hypothetical protein
MGCCQTKLAKGANGKVKLEAVDDEAEIEPQVSVSVSVSPSLSASVSVSFSWFCLSVVSASACA